MRSKLKLFFEWVIKFEEEFYMEESKNWVKIYLLIIFLYLINCMRFFKCMMNLKDYHFL